MSDNKYMISGKVFFATYNLETGEVTNRVEIENLSLVPLKPVKKTDEPVRTFTITVPKVSFTMRTTTTAQYHALHRMLFGSPLYWMLYKRTRHFSKN